jgi:DNA-binding MarR family transcriptional regulator
MNNAPLPIYDSRRAIEHLQKMQEQNLLPIRLFALLFPLWSVETTAVQEEMQSYELIERYIERAIDEAELHTVSDLAHFLGLQQVMIEKILRFLEAIGHVTKSHTFYDLTPLGKRSIHERKKYVPQEKRVKFYFDGYTSRPLRKEHYNAKKVHILSELEAAEVLQRKTWGYRFQRFFSMAGWQQNALQELEARIDRGEYNAPPGVKHMQVLNVEAAYLLMYVIETHKKAYSHAKPHYLAYTGIPDLRDTYLENIINTNMTFYAGLTSEKTHNPAELWHEWLHEKNINGILPFERPDGTWSLSLARTLFEGPGAKFPLTKIGDYELRSGYFIQIWCDDAASRKKAALDRALKTVKNQQRYITRKKLQEYLVLLQKQLQTETLTLTDLRKRAVETKMSDVTNILNALSNVD